MREQDRLRPLQVRVAGHDETLVRLGYRQERAHRLEQAVSYASCGIPNEEVQVERHLVVAAPTRVQLERHVSDDLAQPPLDGRVHVLVLKRPREQP